MKKPVALLLAVAVLLGAQAQVRRVTAESKAPDKKLAVQSDKSLDSYIDKHKQASQATTDARHDEAKASKAKQDKDLSPKALIATIPELPEPQDVAKYLCEKSNAESSQLKRMTNPTAAFLAKIAASPAMGYAQMLDKSETGMLFYMDKVMLEEFGIESKDYAAMSEKERKELATKHADEIQERYLRTVETIGNDVYYTELFNKYSNLDKEIESMLEEAYGKCKSMGEKLSSNMKSISEKDLCEYYRTAAPICHKAVAAAMELRVTQQLPIAQELDTYIQKLAEEHRGEVYAAFFDYSGLCVSAYAKDASRLADIPEPRK